ncbi:MAG: prolipoprotein diacylglyceryl transferase [Sphingomonadales bacterium]|nr:prolipoprotein diacylglyceryl transferase [Sphingomonadales bacterium]
MDLTLLTAAPSYLNFDDLGLDPVIVSLGFLDIRWYSVAYIAGIFAGYWYLLKLIAQPGAPMDRRHADDMIFYGMLGIILGGRLGYVLFYRPEFYLADPIQILRVMDGGMSLHGGVLGVLIAIWWVTRRNKLSFLRFCDYIACVVPFGLGFGRIANFINGELWGRPTDVPWAIIFPASGTSDPRHPSQLYEAGLEGIVLFAVLWFLFWKTDARYKPGLLVGTAAVIYGASRFLIELVRQPDAGLENLSWGLTMGQTLTIPMLLIGIYLIVTAKRRRVRVEPIAGTDSVA